MKFFTLLISLFFLLSCVTKDVSAKKIVKIDINDRFGGLPKLKIQSVVPIETNDNSLFGAIKSLNYFMERFYLLDPFSSKSVLAFSKEGKYINKTKLGRGPGEMTNPYAVSTNILDKKVFIWDQVLKSMFVYDANLNLLSQKDLRDLTPFSNFAMLDNRVLLSRSHYKGDYVYTIYSLDNQSVYKQFVKDMKYSSISIGSPISNRKRTLFIAPFDYTIYQLKDEVVQNELYLDFGKYTISREDVEKYNTSGILELVKKGEKVSGPNDLFESDNYLLFKVAFINEYVNYIYNYKNDEVYCLNNYFESGKLPKCSIRGVIDKDTFYATVEPKDLIDFQSNTGHQLVKTEINPEQNPFILTFSLSEL